MERTCGNCIFRNKFGICIISKKREGVSATETAKEKKCKKHLFKATENNK